MNQNDYDALVTDLAIHQARLSSLKLEASKTQSMILSYEKIVKSIQAELSKVTKTQAAKFNKVLEGKKEKVQRQTQANEKFKKEQKAVRVEAEAKSVEKARTRKPRKPRETKKNTKNPKKKN